MNAFRTELVALLTALLCGCGGQNVERPMPSANAESMQSTNAELQPHDATDRPAEPRRSSPLARLERVGQLEVVGDDPFLSLVVQDQLAFLVQGNVETGKRLRVVDISDPSQPRVVGSCDLGIRAGALGISGAHVYVLDEPHVRVIDVSERDRPREMGSCQLGDHLWDIAIGGTHAFVTDIESLRVVDLSDPTTPSEVGRCEIDQAQGITLAGRHAFVACDVEGMNIVDISDPKAPRTIGRFGESAGAADVAVSGKYAYIAGGEDAVTLWIVDISDPGNTKSVGKYGDRIAGSVALLDEYALVAGGELDIVDVSDPAAPKQAGSFRDVSFVVVQGRDIFVLGDAGFSILRVVQSEKGHNEPRKK
jgi:hypothetical protein